MKISLSDFGEAFCVLVSGLPCALRAQAQKKALQGLRGRGREAHTQQPHSKPTQATNTR